MVIFYQRRGTGRSTKMVEMSSRTGLPIAVSAPFQVDRLKWIAQNILDCTIPDPFVASPEACRNAGEYIVDDADTILQKLLGGKIAMASIADDLNSNEEYLKYLTGRG